MIAVGRLAEAALGAPYIRHPLTVARSVSPPPENRALLLAFLLGGRLVRASVEDIYPEDVEREERRGLRDWYVVDAEGKTLGRLATRIADTLRGEDKPQYTPHTDTGDFVVVVNAEKVAVTGKKLDEKMYYRHSGYPGGLKERSLRERSSAGRPTCCARRSRGCFPATGSRASSS